MRLDKLTLTNFRGFEDRSFDFHPQFNLLIGENGSGKSTLFHAAAVALGEMVKWLDQSKDSRRIEEADIRRASREMGGQRKIEPQFPCIIGASGTFLSQNIYSWQIKRPGGSAPDREIESMRGIEREAAQLRQRVQEFSFEPMPLIAAYGADRLWNEPTPEFEPSESEAMTLSRYEGYRDCLHGRSSKQDLNRWIFKQVLKSLQGNGDTWSYRVLKDAILSTLPGGKDIVVDIDLTQAAVVFENGKVVLLDDLSDGQRTMVTLIGDIARRAICLNPWMEVNVFHQTEGVVLIDELDLHLHPKWQQRVIDDLRRTFPKLQFICTTHAALLIQSLSATEIMALDRTLPPDWKGENSVEDILEDVQGLEVPQRSRKSKRWGKAAERYFQLLQECCRRLSDRILFCVDDCFSRHSWCPSCTCGEVRQYRRNWLL